MEEADKDWMMIRMVGGWVFLLVLAHPGSPGQRGIKRLLLLLLFSIFATVSLVPCKILLRHIYELAFVSCCHLYVLLGRSNGVFCFLMCCRFIRLNVFWGRAETIGKRQQQRLCSGKSLYCEACTVSNWIGAAGNETNVKVVEIIPYLLASLYTASS